jgi:hypothetical protein
VEWQASAAPAAELEAKLDVDLAAMEPSARQDR